MNNDETLPQIFISGVIHGLEACHTAAREILRSYGWAPVWIEDGQIGDRDELRQEIKDCDAVICLVGVLYGSDAPAEGPEKAQSLAQLEFEIAWELDKPVSIFVFAEALPFGSAAIEPAQRQALQAAWRENLLANHWCVQVESLEDFETKLKEIMPTPEVSQGRCPLRAPPTVMTDLLSQPLVLNEPTSLEKDARQDATMSAGFKDSVQFTAYQPKIVAPAKWAKMLVFAHLEERPAWLDEDEPGPIEQMEEEAKRSLGSQAADYGRTTSDSSAIPKDGEITFVPKISGIEFNPPRRVFLWKDGITVHQESFDLRANHSVKGLIATGRLTVFLGHLILAEIALSVEVDCRQGSTAARNSKHLSKTARPFRRVFTSYSRKDLEIVEATERYGRALGDEYIRDLLYLRSGEMWNSQLQELIRWADVFQLFWSENSARSPFVENEWRYALSLSRPTFVRPTYWQEPMPEPPEPLRDIHFHRLVPEVSLAEAAAKPSEHTEVILPMAKPPHDAVFMPDPPKPTGNLPRDVMFMPSPAKQTAAPQVSAAKRVEYKRKPVQMSPGPKLLAVLLVIVALLVVILILIRALR